MKLKLDELNTTLQEQQMKINDDWVKLQNEQKEFKINIEKNAKLEKNKHAYGKYEQNIQNSDHMNGAADTEQGQHGSEWFQGWFVFIFFETHE